MASNPKPEPVIIGLEARGVVALHDSRPRAPWGNMSTTILLVDDDPLQAFARKSILERHFASVERVKSATEALCLIEQPHFAQQLSLVISGHRMPGFSGPAFVAELHSRLPALPILVLGYEGEDAADYATANAHFVPLPMAADKIVGLVRQLLAERQADHGSSTVTAA